MHIYLGSDHAGFKLKEQIKQHLNDKQINVVDCGCYEEVSCDYPDIAQKTCLEFLKDEDENSKVFLFCGTGVGMSIAANKIKGIRAVCANDFFSVKHSRLHNDANVLCMGARVIGIGLCLELIDCFLTHEFQGQRHEKRVKKLEKIL